MSTKINGAWLSNGGLIYIITQIADKFVWRAVHKNGITETGIGWFLNHQNEERSANVEAQWNFHGGDYKAGDIAHPQRPCPGTLIFDVHGKVIEIQWKDRDHFKRVA
jgi:hypothetical protein